MNIKSAKRIRTLLIPALAIASLIISLSANYHELRLGFSDLWQTLNSLIWAVFVIDYCYNLYLAPQKLRFVWHHPLDLLSILPFANFMPGLRALRLLRGLYLIRAVNRTMRTLNRTGVLSILSDFQFLIIATVIMMCLGSALIVVFEKMTFANSLWWSFVTITTVGYGDLSPATNAGRIVAAGLMLFGIGVIGATTGMITNYFLHFRKYHTWHRHASYAEEALSNISKKLYDFDSLTEEDVEQIHAILKALVATKKAPANGS